MGKIDFFLSLHCHCGAYCFLPFITPTTSHSSKTHVSLSLSLLLDPFLMTCSMCHPLGALGMLFCTFNLHWFVVLANIGSFSAELFHFFIFLEIWENCRLVSILGNFLFHSDVKKWVYWVFLLFYFSYIYPHKGFLFHSSASLLCTITFFRVTLSTK